MKLNKKVVVAALALSMGLGAVAPVSNSYAANSVSEIIEAEYKELGENWLKAYNELEAAKAVKADYEEKIKAAEADLQEATNKLVDTEKLNTIEEEEAVTEAEEKVTEANDKLTKAEENKENEYRINKYKEDIVTATKAAEEAKKALETAEKEIKDKKDLAEEEVKKAEKALEALEKEQKEKTIKVDGEDKLIEDAINALEEKEKSAREDFFGKGGTKEALEQIKKTGDVVLPGDVDEEELEVREKIEKALKENRDMVTGLQWAKKMMPNVVKKYEKEYNEIMENSKKAVKAAEEYLNK